MHNKDNDSTYFGIWPALAGYAAAVAIIWLMFELATGIV